MARRDAEQLGDVGAGELDQRACGLPRAVDARGVVPTVLKGIDDRGDHAGRGLGRRVVVEFDHGEGYEKTPPRRGGPPKARAGSELARGVGHRIAILVAAFAIALFALLELRWVAPREHAVQDLADVLALGIGALALDAEG